MTNCFYFQEEKEAKQEIKPEVKPSPKKGAKKAAGVLSSFDIQKTVEALVMLFMMVGILAYTINACNKVSHRFS